MQSFSLPVWNYAMPQRNPIVLKRVRSLYQNAQKSQTIDEKNVDMQTFICKKDLFLMDMATLEQIQGSHK